MASRKFSRAMTDDDDEVNDHLPLSRRKDASINGEQKIERKRKKVQLDEDDEEDENHEKVDNLRGQEKLQNVDEEMEEGSGSEIEEEEDGEKAKPVDEAVTVSGKGRGRRKHFVAFEFEGRRYQLEDPVIIAPEEFSQKPYVAIIKDITQNFDGRLMLLGQWFYHPKEAEKEGGGLWESTNRRELYYSFHRDEVPAEAVMHKCIVHFIPQNNQIPSRLQHPGFIVQKVYDTEQKRLLNLTHKDYEDSKREEIDILVQKTRSRLEDLPDNSPGGAIAGLVDQTSKRVSKMSMAPLNVFG